MKIFNKSSMLAVLALATVFGFAPHATFAAGPSAVNLGSAGNFVILAKSGISTTGSTLITGDIGVSPVAASYITGFGLSLASDNTYSTTPIVVGKVYAADYTAPTPATLSTAISDMQTAYTDAAGRTNPTATELGAGNIGGLTIAPGLYKWGTGVTIPTDVTLSGSATDVWIFQVAQSLSVSSATKVVLSGGAQASNVYWVVAGQVTIGTTAEFNGNILGQTAIVLNTGATLNGRALAQTAVTLSANAVTRVSSGSTVSTPTPTPTPTPTQTPTQTSTQTQTPTQTSTPTPTQIQTQSNTSTTTTITNNTLGASTVISQNIKAVFGQQVRMIAINMHLGNNNNSVAVLQNFLISQGKGSAASALAQVGVTGYFGRLTRAALAEYQADVKISPALGNFGPITRAYLSSQY